MSSLTEAPLRPHWDRPGAIVLAAAFVLSVAVHCATFAGIDIARAFPLVWGLHFAALLGCFAMVIASRSERRAAGTGFAFPRWPLWVYALIIAAFVYAFVNFSAFIAQSRGGSPEVVDGAYVLSSHGRILQTLTLEQYRLQEAYIVRAFSGHWMFFLLVPTCYFLFRDTPPDN